MGRISRRATAGVAVLACGLTLALLVLVLTPAGNVAPEVLGKSVADLELSVRSRKALQRLNINSLGELAMRTEDELLGCKNFGQTSLNEIKQQLASFGMGLRKLED